MEFVLILPLIALMLFGTIDIGRRQCQSNFVYFAKTSEPDFAVIDFPAFSESI